jgi:predicted acyl esterase
MAGRAPTRGLVRRSIVRWVGVAIVATLLGVAPVARATSTDEAVTPYPGGTWQPQAGTYGTVDVNDQRVRMDDGALIAVDVTYPADPKTGMRLPGPFPVILQQDLYDASPRKDAQEATSAPTPNYFAQRGYIFVHSHDRGTGDSEGAMDATFGPRIGMDGVSLAYWASDPTRLPGSNGVVGLQGCSALGVVQLATMAKLGALQRTGQSAWVPGRGADDPGVWVPATDETNPIKASIPECIATSIYHEQFVDNGVAAATFALAFLSPIAGAVLIGTDEHDLMSNMTPTDWAIDMFTGGDEGYYRTHWRERDFLRLAADIGRTGIPILTWVGFRETGFIGAQPLFAALQNHAAGRPTTAPMRANQRRSPKYQLLIGDWAHAEGLDQGLELEWYETWLKGTDTGLQSTPGSIHLKELPSASSDRWISLPRYPMTDGYQALYLDSGSKLSTTKPVVPGVESIVWGAGPSRTFTVTKPNDVDMTLLGPAAARLYVQSTTTNVHLFVQLEDVAPDGTVTAITHGSILGSRATLDPAQSWSSPNGLPVRPMLTLDADRYPAPNQVVQLDVPLYPVTWRLLEGHRLQLTVAPNPGASCAPPLPSLYTKPFGCAASIPVIQSLTGAVFQLHRGGATASFLSAALVPSDSIPTVRSGATPTSKGATLPQDW